MGYSNTFSHLKTNYIPLKLFISPMKTFLDIKSKCNNFSEANAASIHRLSSTSCLIDHSARGVETLLLYYRKLTALLRKLKWHRYLSLSYMAHNLPAKLHSVRLPIAQQICPSPSRNGRAFRHRPKTKITNFVGGRIFDIIAICTPLAYSHTCTPRPGLCEISPPPKTYVNFYHPLIFRMTMYSYKFW